MCLISEEIRYSEPIDYVKILNEQFVSASGNNSVPTMGKENIPTSR